MNDQGNILSIKILDRDYTIKCAPSEAKELQEAARYLDDQMRKVKKSGATNTDRIAVITALNLCYELRRLKKQDAGYASALSNQLNSLQSKIKNSLAYTEELNV